MATKRKTAAVVEAAQPETVEEPAEVETNPLKEAQEAFIARLQGMASFDGGLVWVDCDLPGYEGVRVGYNTDNRYAVQELLMVRPQGLSAYDNYRLYSLFVRRVEWPFNVPAPNPDDPQSYEPLLMQFLPLYQWCLGVGYTKAKDARWGNS